MLKNVKYKNYMLSPFKGGILGVLGVFFVLITDINFAEDINEEEKKLKEEMLYEYGDSMFALGVCVTMIFLYAFVNDGEAPPLDYKGLGELIIKYYIKKI